jgi:hydroxymethylglutaryl-CoA reductase (NADPH)
MQEFTKLPIQFCENLLVKSDCLNGFFSAPLATFELTLFKSVKRGCLLSKYCDGVFVSCGEHTMTRSVILKTDSLSSAISFQKALEEKSNLGTQRLIEEVSCNSVLTSKYCKLISFYSEVAGSLIFLRFAFSTQDAAGHNMTTKSSDEILDFILARYSSFNLSYISVSGNICADKKNSSINGLLSRGRKISAEITVSRKMCLKVLKTTPEKIIELNYYKNYIGSSLAGSIRSANAHFANIIAAFYLAPGHPGIIGPCQNAGAPRHHFRSGPRRH